MSGPYCRRAGWFCLALAVALAPRAAWAEDPPAPEAPAVPAPDLPDATDAPPEPEGASDDAGPRVEAPPAATPEATEAAPALPPVSVPAMPAPTTDVRPRPPPPPPAEVEMPSWDLFFKSRGVCLPPPAPPKDPFECRAIDLRPDRWVSADQRIKEVRRVPQWVDVVRRQDLTEWRPLSIGDLLRRFPNVMIADGGSPFQALPVVRGLGGDRVRILTDGVWPSTQALGPFGSTLGLWDPESAERVEVYHGPGAYLRGAEAGGGVVNVVPRRPHRHECLKDAFFESATAYRSSDNTFRQRLGADFGQGRVAALVGTTYEDHGDRDTADGTLDPSSYRSMAFDAAVDYFLDNQSTIGFTGQYVRAKDIKSPLGGGGLLTQPEYERVFLGMTSSSLDMGPHFRGSRASVTFDSFLQRDDAQADLSLTDGISSKDDVKRLDLHLAGNLYLFDCHDTWAEVTVGYARLKRREAIDCNCDDIGQRAHVLDRSRVHPHGVPAPETPVTGIIEYEAEEFRLKALIEDEWHTTCWDHHVGVRIDLRWLDDDRTGEQVFDVIGGFAAGVAYHPSTCWTIFANGSFGQRYPSVQELFSVAVLDGITVFGNPDLDPETAWNAEVGFKYGSDNHSTAQLAVFAHGIHDFIGRRAVGVDEQWAHLGDVLLVGVEATGAWRPNACCCEGLEFFGMLGSTWSDDEAIVPSVPVHGRVGARYSVNRGPGDGCGLRRWFAEAAVRGAEKSGVAVEDDAFLTTELLAGASFGFGGRRTGTVTLGALNLFDEAYTEPFARLPAHGRSVVASVSFDF